MVKSGDKDAVSLFEQHNKIIMPDHADLSSDDIKSIVEFIKSSTVTSSSTTSQESLSSRFGKAQPNYLPLSIQNNYEFFISYLAAVVILILTLLCAVHVKSMSRKNPEK